LYAEKFIYKMSCKNNTMLAKADASSDLFT